MRTLVERRRARIDRARRHEEAELDRLVRASLRYRRAWILRTLMEDHERSSQELDRLRESTKAVKRTLGAIQEGIRA